MRGLGRLLDLLVPPACAACGAEAVIDAALCARCAAACAGLRGLAACARCGRAVSVLGDGRHGCGFCRPERYWNLTRIVRIGPYEGPLAAAVRAVKYRQRRSAARWLAAQLADRLAAEPPDARPEVLVPVPVHPLRRWARGADHALWLAEALAQRTGLPVRRAVRRIRHTPSQLAALTRAERFAHVRGAFAVRDAAAVAGRRVGLVDNVIVTGATVCEVSRVLRAAGAAAVWALVAARAARGPAGQARPAALPAAGD